MENCVYRESEALRESGRGAGTGLSILDEKCFGRRRIRFRPREERNRHEVDVAVDNSGRAEKQINGVVRERFAPPEFDTSTPYLQSSTNFVASGELPELRLLCSPGSGMRVSR